MGVEMYIQMTFGSPVFNNGTQPSLNLLFDESLTLGICIEYNFGITPAAPRTIALVRFAVAL